MRPRASAAAASSRASPITSTSAGSTGARKVGRHGPQVLVQVVLFAIARLPPQPVDPDQDLTKAEAFDLRNQFIVPVHRQQGLGEPDLIGRGDRRSGIFGQRRRLHPAAIRIMERQIERQPLLFLYRPSEQTFIEKKYGTRVVRPVLLNGDRMAIYRRQRIVNGCNDDGKVIEQSSIPVPNDMTHRRDTRQRFP